MQPLQLRSQSIQSVWKCQVLFRILETFNNLNLLFIGQMIESQSEKCLAQNEWNISVDVHVGSSLTKVKDPHLMNNNQPVAEILCWRLELDIINAEFSKTEIEHAIDCLKNNKSPGTDNIPAEFVKHVLQRYIKWTNNRSLKLYYRKARLPPMLGGWGNPFRNIQKRKSWSAWELQRDHDITNNWKSVRDRRLQKTELCKWSIL